MGGVDKSYHLTCDNWYTSINLFDYLVSKMTDCTGTINKKRKGIPKEVKEANLKVGDCVSMYKGKLMVMKWKAKKAKEVWLLSSKYTAEKQEREKKGKKVNKPEVVHEYNDKMRGVDKSDAHLAYYGIASRGRMTKYYIKQFFYLLDMTALNSYIIYKKTGGTLDRFDFHKVFIRKGLAEFYDEDCVGPLQTGAMGEQHIRLIGRNHFPEQIPDTESTSKPQRKCAYCTIVEKKGRRKNSISVYSLQSWIVYFVLFTLPYNKEFLNITIIKKNSLPKR